MIQIAQQSIVVLHRNVEISAGQQIAFRSKQAQLNYFNSPERKIGGNENMSYIRRSGSLKVLGGTAIIAQCNYIHFYNPNVTQSQFEGHDYFCRVTGFEYVNTQTTVIYYEIDWFQSFMFDVKYETAHIVREHMSHADTLRYSDGNFWSGNMPIELITPESFPANPADYAIATNEYDDKINYSGYELFPDVSTDEDRIIVIDLVDPSPRVDKDVYPDMQYWLDQFQDYSPDNGGNELSLKKLNPQQYFGSIPRASTFFMMRTRLYLQRGIDALTECGCMSNVVGIYYIPKQYILALVNASHAQATTRYINAKDHVDTNADPKLAQFPYAYMEVEAPNGTLKEYRYEWFQNPNSMRFTAQFAVGGIPMVACFPFDYLTWTSGGFPNIRERIEVTDFAQVPCTTDSFLTYMSGQISSAYIAQNNPNAQEERAINVKAEALGGLANAAGGMAVANMPGLQALGAAQAKEGMTQAATAVANYLNEADARKNVLSYNNPNFNATPSQTLGQTAKNMATPNTNFLQNTWHDLTNKEPAVREDTPYGMTAERKAMVSSGYRAGSDGCYWSYAYDQLAVRFKITYRRLRRTLRDSYTEYLKMHGYASGRIGVPRICNYIAGSSDDNALPAFRELPNGVRATYVQTSNMKVISNNMPASSAIEGLFNGGCSFIEGG